MNMTVTVERRDQYGAVVFHPVNETAKTLALIARTKTLTLDTLAHAKTLGYVIEVTHPKTTI